MYPPKGYLSLVLHCHLPYVRHPENPQHFEERWLFEAITETYIPLIKVFDALLEDRVDFRITMSISPTLLSMLEDELLIERYLKHLEKLIELSEKEIRRTEYEPHFNILARMYNNLFNEARFIFQERYGKKLSLAFRKFIQAGVLEIVTCPATHAFLPLFADYPKATRAQIFTACDYHKKILGVAPKGIWLSECGYYPGLDKILKEAGLRYFFVDTHGILNASVRPKYGIYAPLFCDSGVAAFGRDPESSKQVWSSREGYPGDFDYREYYRDIGYDLDYEYIKPYILDEKIRCNTGIKYHRITSKSNYKEAYVPEWARNKASLHAGNFMFYRSKQIEYHSQRMDRPPIVVAPYDAELFGHWWFEGPQWINFLIRKIVFDQNIIELITPSEYLERYPVLQLSNPSASSWGYKGYNEFWLNGSNDWIWPHLHHATRRMENLAGKFNQPEVPKLLERALNQAGRTLLLAQSSDWSFIINTGTVVEYAQRRVKNHLARFHYLEEAILSNGLDERKITALETLDNLFPDFDYRVYA